jgi:hypothetical protein
MTDQEKNTGKEQPEAQDAQANQAGHAGHQPAGAGQDTGRNETGQYGEIEAVAQAAGLDPYDGGSELEGVGNEMSVAGEGAEASYNNDPQDEAGNPEELGKNAVGKQPPSPGTT